MKRSSTDQAVAEHYATIASIRPCQLFDVDDSGSVLALVPVADGYEVVVLGTDRSRKSLFKHRRVKTALFIGSTGRIAVQHDDRGDGLFSISLVDSSGRVTTAVAGERGVTNYLVDAGADWYSYVTNTRGAEAFDLRVVLPSGRDVVIHEADGFIYDVRVSVLQTADGSVGVRAASCILGGSGWQGTLHAIRWDEQGSRAEVVVGDGLNQPTGWAANGDLIFNTDHRSDRTESWRYSFVDIDPPYLMAGVPDADMSVLAADVDGRTIGIRSSMGQDSLFVDSPERVVLSAGTIQVRVSPSQRFVAALASQPARPWKLVVFDRPADQSTVLVETSVPIAKDLRHQQAHAAAHDGERIPVHEYWSPQSQQADRPEPIVVMLHGGPLEHERVNFSPLRLVLAAHGFRVFAPDVRGSTGHGRRWYTLDDRHLRLDAIQDLRSVFRYIRNERGLDGPIFLIGASYGGYLTLCGLTMQPGLWAGGVDVMGIASMTAYLEGTAPFRRAVVEAEYGSLETDRELLERISPSTYADQLDGPLLIIHGALDFRVPLSVSEDFRDRAAASAHDVDLLVFHDESHGVTNVRNWVTLFERTVAFLRGVTPEPRQSGFAPEDAGAGRSAGRRQAS